VKSLRKVVILGGGLAGWAAAAGLARSLRGAPLQILVADALPKDDEPLAEYTLPATSAYFDLLELNEAAVLGDTRAIPRLGTAFSNWPRDGERRLRAFGRYGANIGFIPFHHYASRRRLAGRPLAFDAYSANAVAAQQGRFVRANDGGSSPVARLEYALCMDRADCTALLRRHALAAGVRELRGELTGVARYSDGGIEALLLTDNSRIDGDLFLDCSGPTARLLETELAVRISRETSALRCNRLLSVRTTAHPALMLQCAVLQDAWLLEVPLAGGGCRMLLYSEEYLDTGEAESRLRASPEIDESGTCVSTPLLRGMRERPWAHNCIALGAAAGIPEPLITSELHWLQKDILRLLRLFPADASDAAVAQEYNAQALQGYMSANDYLLINYATVASSDSAFWRMPSMPESFERRRALFTSSGRVIVGENETFSPDEWAAAWLSAGVWPEAFDPLLERMSDEQLDTHFEKLEQAIARGVAAMPEIPAPLAGRNP